MGPRCTSNLIDIIATRCAGAHASASHHFERPPMLDPNPEPNRLPRATSAHRRSDAKRFPYDARLGRFNDDRADPIDDDTGRSSEGDEALPDPRPA